MSYSFRNRRRMNTPDFNNNCDSGKGIAVGNKYESNKSKTEFLMPQQLRQRALVGKTRIWWQAFEWKPKLTGSLSCYDFPSNMEIKLGTRFNSLIRFNQRQHMFCKHQACKFDELVRSQKLKLKCIKWSGHWLKQKYMWDERWRNIKSACRPFRPRKKCIQDDYDASARSRGDGRQRNEFVLLTLAEARANSFNKVFLLLLFLADWSLWQDALPQVVCSEEVCKDIRLNRNYKSKKSLPYSG